MDLFDPGGHRLIHFGRNLWDQDAERIWYDAASVGASTAMWEVPDPDDDAMIERVGFDCKVCRDQGKPWSTSVSVAQIRVAMADVWRESVSMDTPTSVRLVAEPDKM